MEGIKNSIEQDEQRKYEAFKTESEERAKVLLEEIDQKDLSPAEKSAELHALLFRLTNEKENENVNWNRLVVQIIAAHLSKLKENERHTNRIAEIEKAL